MRVAITGSSGMIGSALADSLLADGHEVVRLVRRAAAAAPGKGIVEKQWDPAGGRLRPSTLDGVDAVVNLAGAGIGDQRWSAAYKQELRDSRVKATATMAKAIADAEPRPRVLVSASAIGYYGATGDVRTDESAGPGSDFLAGLCRDWEAAAQPAAAAGARVAHPRFGLIVAPGAGAFGPLVRLARLGLGGRMGSGRQYWSYVSLTDTIAGLRHILDTDAIEGPVNVTAPEPVTNREITKAIGRAVHRPTLFATPGFALRVALGEFAGSVLMSQRVVPAKLLASGFVFKHTTPDAALAEAVASP
jgi:uncharacterized protein